MTKILVTGGAGLIGSHLVEALVLRGDKVVVIDNESTGSRSNLQKVITKIDYVKSNILDKSALEHHISNSDYVVHLAAALGVLNIINNPLMSLKINIQGTENVLELANKFRKPVIIASTSEIYGKNDKVPLSEEDDRLIGHPLISRWSYSEAKAVDESLAYFYYLENNLPIKIVRFFNTVGPRQTGQYGMVIPRFVSAALKNEPLQVYGSGSQIRCFCHVSDVVLAVIMVMESDQAIGQVFNVGNNKQTSILELAKKVIEVTGSESLIEKIPYSRAYPSGYEDMQRRVPDIKKIKGILGWSPQIGLDRIIQDVSDFYIDKH